MAFCCEISALSVNFLNTSNLIFSDATIYVGGLDEKVTEALLWEFFLQAGPVGKLLNIKMKDGQTYLGGLVCIGF